MMLNCYLFGCLGEDLLIVTLMCFTTLVRYWNFGWILWTTWCIQYCFNKQEFIMWHQPKQCTKKGTFPQITTRLLLVWSPQNGSHLMIGEKPWETNVGLSLTAFLPPVVLTQSIIQAAFVAMLPFQSSWKSEPRWKPGRMLKLCSQ